MQSSISTLSKLECPLFGGIAVCKLKFCSKQFNDHFCDMQSENERCQTPKILLLAWIGGESGQTAPIAKELSYRAVFDPLENCFITV